MTGKPNKEEGLLRRFARAAREFVYGATAYETVLLARASRSRIEHVFLLLILGDLLGLPIMRPYHSLRLLPYVIPRLGPWKQTILRERDITDALSGG